MDPKLLAADLETHDPIVQRMHDTNILSCADLSTHEHPSSSKAFGPLGPSSLSSRLLMPLRVQIVEVIGKAYARDFPLHLRGPTGAAAHNVIR